MSSGLQVRNSRSSHSRAVLFEIGEFGVAPQDLNFRMFSCADRTQLCMFTIDFESNDTVDAPSAGETVSEAASSATAEAASVDDIAAPTQGASSC